MKLAPVHITKIVNGGYGFARLATGQIALVRQVLPGEMVIINTEEAKKNHLFGRADEIVQQHPARISPPCKYYGDCGGCDLQHCDYPTQLTLKGGIIEDLLLRQNEKEVRDAVHLLAPPLPSPAEFSYRQRIRLQVGRRGVLGFHRYRSHEIVPIKACLLAGKSINSCLSALRNLEDGQKLCDLSTGIDLQLNPQTGKTVCICHFSRKARPADRAAAKGFCRDVDELERIFFIGEDFPITGPFGDSVADDNAKPDNILSVHYPTIAGLSGPIDLSWEAGGFCQVNLAQNRFLIETVVDFCQPDKTETVLDLYCGMGNFSIPLAMGAREVFGIEGQGSAIRSAGNNAANAGLTNTRFLKSSVHQACLALAESGERFDCVVIDPPRQGAPELAERLAVLTAKRLVYISCDPATLCRDLAALTSEGFTIRKIQPVDMFPQTHHIETVVLLDR